MAVAVGIYSQEPSHGGKGGKENGVIWAPLISSVYLVQEPGCFVLGVPAGA